MTKNGMIQNAKSKLAAGTEPLTDRLEALGTDVKVVGRKAWLAGLGCVATLDEQGRETFEQGRETFEQGRDSVRSTFVEMVDRGRKTDEADVLPVRPVQQALRDGKEQLDSLGTSLERQIETRVVRVLERVGVPSRRDVEQLSLQVERLTRQVETLATSRVA